MRRQGALSLWQQEAWYSFHSKKQCCSIVTMPGKNMTFLCNSGTILVSCLTDSDMVVITLSLPWRNMAHPRIT
ncbi:hypothetical protein Y1Q_0002085 [Alligator mississippiensis]|nr:hypothetical protein Y1Q_0002085 [Alligator mississippiensis]